MTDRNDFNFDDDPFADDEGFGDLDDGFDDGDDLIGSDDFNDFDDDFNDDEEPQRSGPNRAFIIFAILMILLFLGGLAAVLLIATGPKPLSEFNHTETAIAEINATRIINLTETAEQRVAFENQTATEAARPTETPTPEPTATATPTETPDLPPTLEPTATLSAEELALLQTEEAENAARDAAATQTALDGQASATPAAGGGIGSLNPTEVLLTATAISLTLNPPTVDPDVTPTDGTPSGGSPTSAPIGFPTPPSTQLPETGLFDGMATGDGIGTVFLLAFGLMGVIVVSRRMRR